MRLILAVLVGLACAVPAQAQQRKAVAAPSCSGCDCSKPVFQTIEPPFYVAKPYSTKDSKTALCDCFKTGLCICGPKCECPACKGQKTVAYCGPTVLIGNRIIRYYDNTPRPCPSRSKGVGIFIHIGGRCKK